MKKRTLSLITAIAIATTTLGAFPVLTYADNSDEIIETVEVETIEDESADFIIDDTTEEIEEVASEEIVSEEIVEEIAAEEIVEETTEEITEEIIEDEFEETEVKEVYTIEQVAAESQAAENDAFFTVEANGNQDEVISELTDTGLYEAVEGEGDEVQVVSLYANMRIRLVAAADSSIQAYGATDAIYFEDHFLLSYDTEEATMNAYENLVAEYGEENVFIDYPIAAGAIGWGTSYMAMDSEMNVAKSGKNVIVAVLDTGINASHSIFNGTKILGGYNVLTGTTNVSDDTGHGTAVAGIIAESTPANVSILPIKVMSNDRNGSTEDLMNAIAYANKQGADVINMSLGGSIAGSTAYFNYMDRIFAKYPQIIVCASGNENVNADSQLVVPGALTSTVSVGSIDANGNRSSFSNYGSSVDFAAPGQSVRVAYAKSGSTYSTASGTSFATPYVAAAAALIKAENANYTKDDIKNALIKNSKDLGAAGKDIYFGNGCPIFKKATTVAAVSAAKTTTATTTKTTTAATTVAKASATTTVKAVIKNGWIKENGQWHYYKNNSLVKNAWAKDSHGWCWMNDSGNITKNRWILDRGQWYFLKANGYMAANEWAKDSHGWMWMNGGGRITKNAWIKSAGSWYFLKANGYMAANEYAKDSKHTYWMSSNGKIGKTVR